MNHTHRYHSISLRFLCGVEKITGFIYGKCRKEMSPFPEVAVKIPPIFLQGVTGY